MDTIPPEPNQNYLQVSSIKIIKRIHDNHFGFMSGFGYKNGTYELGTFEAAVFEMECTGTCTIQY